MGGEEKLNRDATDSVIEGNEKTPKKKKPKRMPYKMLIKEELYKFFTGTVSPRTRARVRYFLDINRERMLKTLRLKPFLRYVEVHLVDHCNLNCRGCSHFSPIAGEWFADVNQYEKDMRRLTELFRNVNTVRLMGGEPLLHPQIESFVALTKRYFPKADVRVVTNGILLPAMQDLFWEMCRSNSVILDVTVYPPLKGKEQFFRNLANSKSVKTDFHSVSAFSALYNDKGDSDVKRSFLRCRSWQYCPNLREGRLYVCPVPAYVHYFNETFGSHVPEDGWLDIHAQSLSGWDVLALLDKATSACRYCMFGWKPIRTFPWSHSTRSVKDWQATVK